MRIYTIFWSQTAGPLTFMIWSEGDAAPKTRVGGNHAPFLGDERQIDDLSMRQKVEDVNQHFVWQLLHLRSCENTKTDLSFPYFMNEFFAFVADWFVLV